MYQIHWSFENNLQNPRIDRKIRIEAAKAALPYEFGKVGEDGVKKSEIMKLIKYLGKVNLQQQMSNVNSSKE